MSARTTAAVAPERGAIPAVPAMVALPATGRVAVAVLVKTVCVVSTRSVVRPRGTTPVWMSVRWTVGPVVEMAAAAEMPTAVRGPVESRRQVVVGVMMDVSISVTAVTMPVPFVVPALKNPRVVAKPTAVMASVVSKLPGAVGVTMAVRASVIAAMTPVSCVALVTKAAVPLAVMPAAMAFVATRLPVGVGVMKAV